LEEELKMPYINSAKRIGEKMGIEKGILLGIDQGVEQSIRRLLLKGFKPSDVAQMLDEDKNTVLRISKELRKSESKPGMV
jgi:hypothetical protein